MSNKNFLWHAKRGHGECIQMLEEGNIIKYKEDVKKVSLNNYAYSVDDEFRSAYACVLLSYFNEDNLFLEMIWKKLFAIDLADYTTFSYLIDNIYFLLKKNASFDYKDKIVNLLAKCLDKEYYSIDESNSINSILSLVFDLRIDVDISSIIKNYYSSFSNSNLDLSNTDYIYKTSFNKEKAISSIVDTDIFKNSKTLLNHISNDFFSNKEIPYISNNISSEFISFLTDVIITDSVDNLSKTNILKIMYFSGKCYVSDIVKIIKQIHVFNEDQKRIICGIVTGKESKKLINIIDSIEIDKSLYIIICLSNYKYDNYTTIHKMIKTLCINYSDSEMWFEVENSLIHYFNKRVVDKRLLNDLTFFLNNGLSSFSRLNIVKILLKYNYLSKRQIDILKNDANVRIRNLLHKL